MANFMHSEFNKTVIGINFGDSYASIAVINKEGQPECIANEDGERQIAAAISYSGEEIYVGNGAKPQLVKNAQNTITQFRNLLGKKFSSLPSPSETTSAPVIKGSDDKPAYAVTVLVPPTPAPSVQATPISTPRPSSPRPSQKILTVDEAATDFLRSLHDSALDFLGKPIDGGAVITVPSWFDEPAKEALKRAAEAAGFKVLQLLDESAAAVVAYQERDARMQDRLEDKITLVLDIGASSLHLSLLSINQGLIHLLGSLTDTSIGGNAIDDLLITHFAKEFTKKTKIPLQFPNATSPEDKRAEAKLRLAVEHTKRSISAPGGSGSATCSVESLKDGYDFSGTITRLRFDLLVNKVYKQVAEKVKEVLVTSDVDATMLDEILLVGATASFGGLYGEIQAVVQEETVTHIRGELETFEVLAKGAVLQARLLASIDDEKELKAATGEDAESLAMTKVNATTKPIGIIFPGETTIGGIWVPVVVAHTPLPLRRVVRLAVDPSKTSSVAIEVWEGKDVVKVEKPEKREPVDGESEEEEEEEEIRTRDVEKETLLGGLDLPLSGNSKKKVSILIKIQMEVNGALEAKIWQEGSQDQGKTLKVGA